MNCLSLIRACKAHPEIGFILLFEMFQRFSSFGYLALTFLYLKHELQYSLGAAIALYHLLLALGYFFSIFFSVVADKWLSKYCVIMIAALIALVGDVVLIVGAFSVHSSGQGSTLSSHTVPLSLLGLVLRAVGAGGMREVVRAYGGDQFRLPEEENYLLIYYQAFYYFMAFGTVAGIIAAPLIRMHTECSGEIYCFPFAFLAATLALVCAIAALIAGGEYLAKGRSKGSVVVETWACVLAALRNHGAQCGHTWLDNARETFTENFICDVRATLQVLVLFLPLPFFWALFEQQGSLWVYQATRMIWTVSSGSNLYVEPDQMPMITHLTVFLTVPVLQKCILPLCGRVIFCRTPLRRIIIGALFALLAFIVATLVQRKVEPTLEKVPRSGAAHLVFFNLMRRCPLQVYVEYSNGSTNHIETITVPNIGHEMMMDLPVKDSQIYKLGTFSLGCNISSTYGGYMTLPEGRAVFIYQTPRTLGRLFRVPPGDDLPFDLKRCDIQLPINHILYAKGVSAGAGAYNKVAMRVAGSEVNRTFDLDANHHATPSFHAHPVEYAMNTSDGDVDADEFTFTPERGGVYVTYFLQNGPNMTADSNLSTITDPLNVHMGFQIPQYILMGLAYFLLPVTLLHFGYQQVAVRMRPVLLSFWYFTIAVGNLVVVVLAVAVERVLWILVLYTALMGATFMLLLILFCNYVVVEPDSEDEDGK